MIDGDYPRQARMMSKRDIADLRRWHVDAAKRAREAGYDIINPVQEKIYEPNMHMNDVAVEVVKAEKKHRA